MKAKYTFLQYQNQYIATLPETERRRVDLKLRYRYRMLYGDSDYPFSSYDEWYDTIVDYKGNGNNIKLSKTQQKNGFQPEKRLTDNKPFYEYLEAHPTDTCYRYKILNRWIILGRPEITDELWAIISQEDGKAYREYKKETFGSYQVRKSFSFKDYTWLFKEEKALVRKFQKEFNICIQRARLEVLLYYKYIDNEEYWDIMDNHIEWL